MYGFHGKVLSLPGIRAGSDSSRVDTIPESAEHFTRTEAVCCIAIRYI